MVRVFWLAVVCLSGVFGIVAYKIGAAASASGQLTIPLSVATADLLEVPLAKSDRLDADRPAAATNIIHTIPIIVMPEFTAAKVAPKPSSAEKIPKIVSRHWHASYARMARRVERQTPTPPAVPEEPRKGILGWLKIGG
jgi:hypothetical protein